MKKIGLYLIVGFLFSFSSCKNDNEEDLYPIKDDSKTACDTSNLTYENFVKPLFASNCATSGCHDGNSGKIAYTTYDIVKMRSENIRNRVLILKDMPQNGPLSDCDQQKLEHWIDNQMPEK